MRRFWWVPLGYLPLLWWFAEKATIHYFAKVDGCMAEGSAEGCVWLGRNIDAWLMSLDDGLPWDSAFAVPVTAGWTLVVVLALVFSRFSA